MLNKSLIELICKGKDPKYKNQHCYHFSSPSNCQLLEGKKKLEIIFTKKGLRCNPLKKLKDRIKLEIYKYRDKIDTNEFDSIVFETEKKIKKYHLTYNYNITSLFSYINATVKTVVSDLVSIYSRFKYECGNCKYLEQFQIKEYFCNRESLTNGKANHHFKKKRKLSDRACDKGFEKITIEETTEDFEISDQMNHSEGINLIYNDLCKILINRQPQPKTHNRQYQVFIRFCQLKMANEKNINIKIAKELDVTDKTVERDIKEILDYLKKNVSLNDFISS